MAESKHVSASLRLLTSEHEGIRTFTGVRRVLTRQNVQDFMEGINALTVKPAHSAMHTVRAELVPGQ